MRLQNYILLFLVIFFTACAIPTNDFQATEYVPESEQNVTDLVSRASTYYSRGRFLSALDALQQAESLAPDSRVIRRNIAQTAIRLERYEYALPFLEALEKEKNDTDINLGFARLYKGLDASDKSEAYYKKGISEALKNKEWKLAANGARDLATIYFENGNIASMLCYSSLAYSLDPSKDDLLRHFDLLIGSDIFNPVIRSVQVLSKEDVDDELKYRLLLAYIGKKENDKSDEVLSDLLDNSHTSEFIKGKVHIIKSLLDGDNNKNIPSDDKLYWPSILAVKG